MKKAGMLAALLVTFSLGLPGSAQPPNLRHKGGSKMNMFMKMMAATQKEFTGCIKSIGHLVGSKGKMSMTIAFKSHYIHVLPNRLLVNQGKPITLKQLAAWEPVLKTFRQAAAQRHQVHVTWHKPSKQVTAFSVLYNKRCGG